MGICAEGKAYLPHRYTILLNCILRQYQKPPFLRLTGWLKGERPECGLHPLIHTLLEFNVAQSVAHSLCEIASGFVERVGGEAGKVVIK